MEKFKRVQKARQPPQQSSRRESGEAALGEVQCAYMTSMLRVDIFAALLSSCKVSGIFYVSFLKLYVVPTVFGVRPHLTILLKIVSPERYLFT